MYKAKGISLSLVLIAILLLVGCAKQSTILGTVFDSDYGMNLEGATVTLLKGATAIATTTTDANGTYYFAGIDEGEYSISVAYPGTPMASYDEQYSLDGGTTWQSDAAPGDDVILAEGVSVTGSVTVVQFRFYYMAA